MVSAYSLTQEMQRMSKQKGGKVKSKFRSALMNEFSKKVSSTKGNRITQKNSQIKRKNNLRIVASIREESEYEREKYFTREKLEMLNKGKLIFFF